MQQLGRSHRANQASAPLYVLLTTDVGGEARFASAVARRLQALGALTKGDRRAEIGPLDSFNFDTAWGKRALRHVLSGIYEGSSTVPAVQAALGSADLVHLRSGLEAIGAGNPAERDKLEVKRFLNRLLGLPLREQGALFDLFAATLQGVIEAARRDGKYDEGIADLSGATVSLEEPEALLWRDPLTAATMRAALLRVDRGVSFEAAHAKLVAAVEQDVADRDAARARKARAAELAAADGGAADSHGASADAAGGEAGGEAGSEAGGEEGMVDLPDLDEDDEEEYDEDAMDEADRRFIVDDEEEESDEEDEEEGGGHSDDDEEEEEEGEGADDADGVAGHGGTGTEGAGDGALPAATTAALARSAAGFYRSRFLQAGKERLYLLAIPRANRRGHFYLTRPATGLSPFEEEEADLRRKYERVSPEQARQGWDAAYAAADHESAGGRLSHVQILTGSTLPLMPLLEGLVKKHAPRLTHREQAVQAVRVQMEATRLVGVRFPRLLMAELREELLAFQLQRGASGALKLTIDPLKPVDEREVAKALKPPTTLRSFFGAPKQAPSAASGAASAHRGDVSSAHAPTATRSAAATSAPRTAPPASTVPAMVVDLVSDGEAEGDEQLARQLQRQYDAEAVARVGAGSSGGGRAPGGGSERGGGSGMTPASARGGKSKLGGRLPGQTGLAGWLGGAKGTAAASGGSGSTDEMAGPKRKSIVDTIAGAAAQERSKKKAAP